MCFGVSWLTPSPITCPNPSNPSPVSSKFGREFSTVPQKPYIKDVGSQFLSIFGRAGAELHRDSRWKSELDERKLFGQWSSVLDYVRRFWFSKQFFLFQLYQSKICILLFFSMFVFQVFVHSTAKRFYDCLKSYTWMILQIAHTSDGK
jgi:hypothetical protein